MTNSKPAPHAWADNLRPGYVVAFHFPLSDSEVQGKARPCLVIAMQRSEQGPTVTLAYGTTATTSANRGLVLPLEDSDDWNAAGLREPTRFVLARRMTVRANDPRFDGGPLGNPTIGRITGHSVNRLKPLIELLGASIADDCRHGQPVERSRPAAPHQGNSTVPRRAIVAPARCSRRDRNRSTRTVIVEHRRKRLLRPPIRCLTRQRSGRASATFCCSPASAPNRSEVRNEEPAHGFVISIR